MDPAIEIRKLPPSNVRELAQILEYAESWKRLMAIIPKTLAASSYDCDVNRNNLRKYNSEHFRLIENASSKLRKSCTEILFDEWGTSGRIRPALGHLLHLLVRAELFRAADYVAVSLLHMEAPARPSDGPAALVSTTIPASTETSVDPTTTEIEHILDAIDYTGSVIANLKNTYEDNIDHSSRVPDNRVIPEIFVSEIAERKIEENQFQVPIVIERSNSNNESVIKHNEVKAANTNTSDMIKFSTNANVPDLSGLLEDTTREELDSGNIPEISALNAESSSENIPAFSQILSDNIRQISIIDDTIQESIPNLSILTSNRPCDTYIPNLSIINGTESSNSSNSSHMPSLSELVSISDSSLRSGMPVNASNHSPLNSASRTNCNSPLPNLSLNTLLPHFTYHEIEISTNNFDSTPHKNSLEVDDSLAEDNGRFLGSGAFGSVFLALGHSGNPLAVKKLYLNNVNVVNVDDTVTKQFRNEVEILSRYKHENLLSLIGYSCDGPTYCLVYEYISGGALNDRLLISKEKLSWQDRLCIASGTAKAVSYLHTAFQTPLIHRDIKTANILLDCSKRPKLCDFGLIKLTPNQNTITSTTVFGTSAYMAPEAFRGDISVKLDTFSFGVVVLELLTGLPPLDERREGVDLVTHVDEICEGTEISPLLDKSAGSWVSKDINYGQELYKVTLPCLEEKKKRPTMVDVSQQLTELCLNMS